MPTPSDAELAWSDADTIAFGDRLAASQAFLALFREGMGLIEETASYLDGPGRDDSRELTRGGALAYATESMRLTTRLMQLASWLLLQRAVNEGELTKEQARTDKSKVRLGSLGPREPVPATDGLPDPLRHLVARSLRLRDRVLHLDRLLYAQESRPSPDNPIGRDLERLNAAFARR